MPHTGHVRKIGWWLLALIVATGCARPRYGVATGPEQSVSLAERPPMPLSAVWLIERGGASPRDTVVAVPAGDARTVVMRHPAPDNATFAIVSVPADSAATGTLELTLSPEPGRYGLTITAVPEIPAGTTVRFSYAAHFIAPEGTTARYPSLPQLEQALGIGFVQADSLIQFVAARRTAGELLQFPVANAGTYYLAAPR